MNVKLRTLLFALLFFMPPSVHAVRTARTFPIDTPTSRSSADGSGAGVCWAGPTRRVSLINLSDIPQTVTIRIYDIEMAFGSCDGATPTPPYGGNWTQWVNSPSCWRSGVLTAPETSRTVTLAPNESRTISFTAWCRLRRSGVTNCSVNYDPLQAERTTDLMNTRVQIARTTMEIQVREDRGAVLANISALTESHCNDLENNTRFNVPVNGGRPF